MSQRSNNLLLGIGAAAGIGLAAGYLMRPKRSCDFAGKTVLITGGSRGLGLVLARQFAVERARIAICARDKDELDRAVEDLRSRGAEVFSVVCDVRNQESVRQLVEDVRSHFGVIDVLVNNAGVIQMGPLELQTQQDYEEAMAVHFWGPYYAMNEVLPEMRERGDGRIINIASIGGKISVPHLVPYCASKFALVGLSAGMQSELAKHGIAVTTVCPGLMRTGSHINAYFKGQNEAEYTLFSLAGSLPVSSISAERAARQIVDAARRGEPEIILSPQAAIAAKLHGLFPQLTSSLLSLTDRLLLPAPGGIGKRLATGLESTTAISPSVLTSLNDRASYRNNELKPNEQII